MLRDDELEKPRLVIKLEMIDDRIRKYGKIRNSCPCDYCQKNPGTQMHELINRNRTAGNDEVRKLTFSKFLCSIVCPECHTGSCVVTTRKARSSLFMRNCDLYGYEMVHDAFKAVPEPYRAFIELPSLEEFIEFSRR